MTNPMKQTYRIKELRKERGLTQKKLAEAVGYAQSVICDWEKGVSDPSAQAVIQLARFFQVSTDFLLGLTDF